MRPPLAGIRLLDLSWIVAGPLCSRLLADFGADVIKVETAGRMDVSRANRTPLYGVLPGDANTNPETGGYFQDTNAGKRSCALNLGHPEGRALLRRLAAVCDGIVCNLGGDQLERWGIGYEVVRRINPGIIVVNMPTMASSGPRARWRAFGDMIAAGAGMKSISGHPEDGPLPFGHQYPDFSANPLHAAVGLMAALHARERTGEGQFVEVSQLESTIALLGTSVLEYSASGEPPRQRGNQDVTAVPHNFYRCRDAGEAVTPRPPSLGSARDMLPMLGEGEDKGSCEGRRTEDEGRSDSWIAIAVETDAQWRALAAIEGLEALRQPAYATAAGRRRHLAAIDAAIEAWTCRWDRQELAAFLQARGVPAGAYQDIAEMVHADPTLGEAHFARWQHPLGREFLIHRNPIRLAGYQPPDRGGPLLGADTFDVLHDLLGLTPDELADAAAAGAIE